MIIMYIYQWLYWDITLVNISKREIKLTKSLELNRKKKKKNKQGKKTPTLKPNNLENICVSQENYEIMRIWCLLVKSYNSTLVLWLITPVLVLRLGQVSVITGTYQEWFVFWVTCHQGKLLISPTVCKCNCEHLIHMNNRWKGKRCSEHKRSREANIPSQRNLINSHEH